MIVTLWRELGCVREILELAEVSSVGHDMQGGESNGDAARGTEEEDVAPHTMFVTVIVTSVALRSS